MVSFRQAIGGLAERIAPGVTARRLRRHLEDHHRRAGVVEARHHCGCRAASDTANAGQWEGEGLWDTATISRVTGAEPETLGQFLRRTLR
jgi:hypothetical protein